VYYLVGGGIINKTVFAVRFSKFIADPRTLSIYCCLNNISCVFLVDNLHGCLDSSI